MCEFFPCWFSSVFLPGLGGPLQLSVFHQLKETKPVWGVSSVEQPVVLTPATLIKPLVWLNYTSSLMTIMTTFSFVFFWDEETPWEEHVTTRCYCQAALMWKIWLHCCNFWADTAAVNTTCRNVSLQFVLCPTQTERTAALWGCFYFSASHQMNLPLTLFAAFKPMRGTHDIVTEALGPARAKS